MRRSVQRDKILLCQDHTVHAQAIGPAPKGPAEQVAMAAIKDAGHPCGTIVRAARTDGGGIRAVCSNGEAYRVFTVDGRDEVLGGGEAGSLGMLRVRRGPKGK